MSLFGKPRERIKSLMQKYPKLQRYSISVWFFPIVLLMVLLLLTAFRISGSSVGVYHEQLYGTQAKDNDLLFGHPQGVRSDEWLVNTQLTIAQSKSGFPHINKNFESGRDMSLIVDVPYAEWSAFFKPQNLIFFLLPLEYAFAFKWWLLLCLLMVSCYFFVLKIRPKKKLLATLLSLGFGFSPFVFWWYQTITIAPLFYGFFILILSLRLLNKEKIPWIKNDRTSDFLQCLVLAYLIACFGLVLYPPFQIVVAIALVAFLVGYILQKLIYEKNNARSLLKRVGLLLLGLLLAGVIGAIFVATRADAISTITHTSHPGTRVIPSGGLNPLNVLDGFLMPLVQDSSRATNFFNNQSEASNFVLLLPFLLLPGFVILVYQYKKTRRINFTLMAIQLCSVLFLARVFLPVGDEFYHLLLLQKVPNERVIMGLGLLGFFQILYIMQCLDELKVKRTFFPSLAILSYGLSCMLALTLIGYYTRIHYPLFLHDYWSLFGLSLIFTTMIVCLLCRRYQVFSVLLLTFTVLSVWNINPLYQGLGVLTDNKVIDKIQQKPRSGPSSTWVTLGSTSIEEFPQLSDRHSITGVQIYPDLALWKDIVGQQFQDIYDRYAHAVFINDPGSSKKMWLIQKNVFAVNFDCSDYIKKHVAYALSSAPVSSECLSLTDTIRYPAQTFFIYKVASR